MTGKESGGVKYSLKIFHLHGSRQGTWKKSPSDLNIFGQQRHHVEKKTKRCVKSCENVSVVTINDRERKWRCEIQFKDISSTQ